MVAGVSQLQGNTFQLFNTANMVLLPKKENATVVAEYRPISLIHSVGKIFSQTLANRLAPKLHEIVSINQSVVKKRCIHDNYIYVQSFIKEELHTKKKPTLFIKLDIAKAFDSVLLAYMMELLHVLGFGNRWRAWIILIMATSTTRILLNGCPGKLIRHQRGLREGDPLSPMLCILAIDPLQKILQLAIERGLIKPVQSISAKVRISLYADDTAIFINPCQEDLQALRTILHIFGEASGLKANLNKTMV